jgi:hypothetical protein
MGFLRPHNKVTFYHQVWPNGTGNGMWGNVAMDVAIMGFGSTYAWLENYPYLDYSLPYFRSYVHCLTPCPQKLPGWMVPLLPFSPNMWVAVGISMLITTTSLYLVTRTIMSLLGKFTLLSLVPTGRICNTLHTLSKQLPQTMLLRVRDISLLQQHHS